MDFKHVNSLTGFAPSTLEPLFTAVSYTDWPDPDGIAPSDAVFKVWGGCELVGGPTIRGAAWSYCRKPNGRPYTRRRINQWLARADFFVCRYVELNSGRQAKIPATEPGSLHAFLDACLATAAEGKIRRTRLATDQTSGSVQVAVSVDRS
jgi:hypothetical protein